MHCLHITSLDNLANTVHADFVMSPDHWKLRHLQNINFKTVIEDIKLITQPQKLASLLILLSYRGRRLGSQSTEMK